MATLNNSDLHHLVLQQGTLRCWQNTVFFRMHPLLQYRRQLAFRFRPFRFKKALKSCKLDAQLADNHLPVAGTPHPVLESLDHCFIIFCGFRQGRVLRNLLPKIKVEGPNLKM